MPRPTTGFPEFATLDQVDGVSGQNNVVEPGTAFKSYGWVRRSRPVRQFLNWLARLTNLWLVWLDEITADNATDIATNLSSIVTNLAAIQANALAITGNTTDISTNVGAISAVDSNLTTETGQRVSADSTLQGNIDTEESARIAADGILTSAVSAVNAEIDEYDDDTTFLSGTMELAGFAANQSVNYFAVVKRSRYGANEISIIDLYLPETLATSTGVSLYFTSATIPAALRPSAKQNATIFVQDNTSSNPLVGAIELTTTGDWLIHLYDGSAFTGSGTKGLEQCLVRYRLSYA